MDSSCLEHPLTEEETLRFKQDGYLIVKDVLPADRVSDLVTTVDRVDAEERARMGIGDGLIRLSIGLEDSDDLKEDLERALKVMQA